MRLVLVAVPLLALPTVAPASACNPTDRASATNVAFVREAPIVVRVVGMRNMNGVLHVSLFRSATGFPEADSSAASSQSVRIVGQEAEVRFEGVAAGSWAIAVLHDENGNRRLDRFFGIPKEGVGATNDAARSGPPKFEQARFEHGATTTELRIRLRYWM